MKFALLNPNWTFEGSIYFGCREPHLPLEFGYSREFLEREGHDALLLDAQMEDLSLDQVFARVADFDPDFLVVTTAPSYLFWRCPPPELRVPQETLRHLAGLNCKRVIVGPHGSTTPRSTLRKLNADVVVLGECEEILPMLVNDWAGVPSICYRAGGHTWTQEGRHASDMSKLPVLHWSREYLNRHKHHHHRFDAAPGGPGAEVEASRGCPYHCTFCAKDNFRDDYRRRSVPAVLQEIDSLLDSGVEYIYFIDEIFLPNKELLEGLGPRRLKFGIQTRIDLWNKQAIDLLGRLGCVSIEAGVESITEAGRAALDKKCRLSTDDLSERLIHAKNSVPFVQANLLQMEGDEPQAIEEWREALRMHGVWANAPVPLFPYPGSPDYTLRWGEPDDRAWERAHAYYLERYSKFSDVQLDAPQPLEQLEMTNVARHQ